MKPKSMQTPDNVKIRVLVADDHLVVRHGIIANLNPQPDMTVVAEAGDGVEALELIKEHLPDVVMLDLRMPRMDGLDVIAEVSASRLSSKVIILTTFESQEDVHRAVKAGARGYLLRDSSQEEILDAIRRVSLGETYLPARIVQKVAEGLRKPELSPREVEVLQWVAAGKSNKEIGAQLFIAEGTVKTHVKNLLEKLGAVGPRSIACRAAAARFPTPSLKNNLLRWYFNLSVPSPNCELIVRLSWPWTIRARISDSKEVNSGEFNVDASVCADLGEIELCPR